MPQLSPRTNYACQSHYPCANYQLVWPIILSAFLSFLQRNHKNKYKYRSTYKYEYWYTYPCANISTGVAYYPVCFLSLSCKEFTNTNTNTNRDTSTDSHNYVHVQTINWWPIILASFLYFTNLTPNKLDATHRIPHSPKHVLSSISVCVSYQLVKHRQKVRINRRARLKFNWHLKTLEAENLNMYHIWIMQKIVK